MADGLSHLRYDVQNHHESIQLEPHVRWAQSLVDYAHCYTITCFAKPLREHRLYISSTGAQTRCPRCERHLSS